MQAKPAEIFYKQVIQELAQAKIPFLIGGTYAVTSYTDIERPTKDLDIFTTAGDYTKVLQTLKSKDFTIEITDARWLAKIIQGDFFVDVLFGTANETCRVDNEWFTHASPTVMFGEHVKLVPLEELIWIKSFMQDRRRSEGPDVNHLILRKGNAINWRRLFMRMDPYWELLLSHILEFRFIYPSERDIIPMWLMRELIGRVDHELELPSPKEKICRGTLLSRLDYEPDITKWGFKTVLEI